jgi:hypothetical protein
MSVFERSSLAGDQLALKGEFVQVRGRDSISRGFKD